jgi:ADP-ribosylglycohydrolase
MLGAIIGDIVGSRWEFNPTNDYNFEWLSAENNFTDDTICTMAVADALLNGKDFGDAIHEWCNRYPYPMGGYGGRFRRWVHSSNPEPYGSFGNGSAMRVSPVAHWYETETEVLDAAAATALPTHNHPEGIKGAQTVALAIFKAMQFNRMGYQAASMHIDEILEACVQFSGYDINMPKSAVLNKFDETCQGTVPVALKIIRMAYSFEDAIRMAVCIGADADTLGAIVGSIAEPIWGIPLSIRFKIEKFLPNEMKDILDDFHRARHRSSKPLIDTTFGEKDFSEAAWDTLEDKEREELMGIVEKEKNKKRRVMAERAKARYYW